MTSKIICDDAFKWLSSQKDNSLDSIVTGIPDLDELEELNKDNMSVEEYSKFFTSAVELILRKVRANEYTVLMQTDRKMKGQWVDKSFLANSVAHKMGVKLMWHKIIQNREGTYLQRPTYTHMLAFSKNGTPGEAFPDIVSCGQHLYKNATSPNATCHVMNFLKKKGIKSVLDPFTGRGTIPYIATLFEINSIGIDIDPKQCKEAEGIFKNKKMIKIISQTDYFTMK
jgi:hypothetical protein